MKLKEGGREHTVGIQTAPRANQSKGNGDRGRTRVSYPLALDWFMRSDSEPSIKKKELISNIAATFAAKHRPIDSALYMLGQPPREVFVTQLRKAKQSGGAGRKQRESDA